MAEMMTGVIATPKKAALETKVWIKLWPPTTDYDKAILSEMKGKIVNTREEVTKAIENITKRTIAGKGLLMAEETLSLISRMMTMACESSYLGVNENGQLFLSSDADIGDPQYQFLMNTSDDPDLEDLVQFTSYKYSGRKFQDGAGKVKDGGGKHGDKPDYSKDERDVGKEDIDKKDDDRDFYPKNCKYVIAAHVHNLTVDAKSDDDSVNWWNCEEVRSVRCDGDTRRKVYLHTERRENLYLCVKWETASQQYFVLGQGIDREKSTDGYVFEIQPIP